MEGGCDAGVAGNVAAREPIGEPIVREEPLVIGIIGTFDWILSAESDRLKYHAHLQFVVCRSAHRNSRFDPDERYLWNLGGENSVPDGWGDGVCLSPGG